LLGKNVSLERAEEIEQTIEDEEADSDDLIREAIRRQGRRPNISVYAFTATPKVKTLAVFGVRR
jgi:type I restriction enzyme R subunit